MFKEQEKFCDICGKDNANCNLWKEDKWIRLCLNCYKKLGEIQRDNR